MGIAENFSGFKQTFNSSGFLKAYHQILNLNMLKIVQYNINVFQLSPKQALIKWTKHLQFSKTFNFGFGKTTTKYMKKLLFTQAILHINIL